jgi:aryl-alcohol dehydrogenase (NADP+)
MAETRGVTPAQIALAWLLHKPGVAAPIIGATKMPHLEQAVEALEIKLREEDIRDLEEPYVPHPVLGHQ